MRWSYAMNGLCSHLTESPNILGQIKFSYLVGIEKILLFILSFLTFDELLVLNNNFRNYYRYSEALGNEDLLWKGIRDKLNKNGRILSMTLDDFGPIEPDFMFVNIRTYINPLTITSLHLDLTIQNRWNDCAFFHFNFDFSALINLRHLLLSGVALGNVRVIANNLISLKLDSLENNFHREICDDTALIALLRRCNNLQILKLDRVPHFGNAPISNVLTKMILDGQSADSHSVAHFLNLQVTTSYFLVYEF